MVNKTLVILSVFFIMAGLRSKYQSFCFYRAMTNFPFCFPLFLFLNGLDQRISQTLETVAKFQRIINPVCGRQCKFIFPRNFASFSSSSRLIGKHSQFSQKLFNQFENCLRIMIKVLEFYNKCTA